MTIPDVEFAVATAELLLHHVPLPPTVAVSTVLEPTHTVRFPETVAGSAFTAMVFTAKQLPPVA